MTPWSSTRCSGLRDLGQGFLSERRRLTAQFLRFPVQFCLSLFINDLRETAARGLHKRVYILSQSTLPDSGSPSVFAELAMLSFLGKPFRYSIDPR